MICRLFFFVILLTLNSLIASAQAKNPLFRIRTITAGINLENPGDTLTILKAIQFLEQARSIYEAHGYEVQTIRIATQNFYRYTDSPDYRKYIPDLVRIDRMAEAHHFSFSIGQILEGDQFREEWKDWAVTLVNQTNQISFSVPISSHEKGILKNSIRMAAAITTAISRHTKGGEGNFRFTASANCPPGSPFFPAAYHEGPPSFAIGLESPNLLTESFRISNGSTAKEDLKSTMESALLPIQQIADSVAIAYHLNYDGIDVSPAPGLDASIGRSIETYTKKPFGSPSTLSACSLITDVLKNLNIKKCGYSGLMLPVIEDPVLAKRAAEGLYSVQELLLYSSVSGTGLDVVPLPGDIPVETIERLLTDVASLSLKYTNKALSARLFPIPGKKAGEQVSFRNPYLTSCTVMKLE